jgi:hypothetical protein
MDEATEFEHIQKFARDPYLQRSHPELHEWSKKTVDAGYEAYKRRNPVGGYGPFRLQQHGRAQPYETAEFMNLAAESSNTFDRIIAERQQQAAQGHFARQPSSSSSSVPFAKQPSSSSSSGGDGYTEPKPKAHAKQQPHKQRYSASELIEVMAEAQVARSMNLKWRERGPPPSPIGSNET